MIQKANHSSIILDREQDPPATVTQKSLPRFRTLLRFASCKPFFLRRTHGTKTNLTAISDGILSSIGGAAPSFRIPAKFISYPGSQDVVALTHPRHLLSSADEDSYHGSVLRLIPVAITTAFLVLTLILQAFTERNFDMCNTQNAGTESNPRLLKHLVSLEPSLDTKRVPIQLPSSMNRQSGVHCRPAY